MRPAPLKKSLQRGCERRENRGAPYLFLKPTRGAVIGDGDSVVIPYGRNQTDWEVELGTVIGTTAKYVSADNAGTIFLVSW